MSVRLVVFTAWGMLWIPAVAAASERTFTYSQETGVLPPKSVEIEPWTTVRTSRENAYVRFDHRMELELGATDRLQAAFYVNFSAIDAAVGGGYESELEFGGVSLEAKYKVLDPVADAVGLALYVEPTFAPHEQELEGKILLDKRIGPWIAAANLVSEYEWAKAADGEREEEAIFELDLGVARALSNAVTLGLEVRNHNPLPRGAALESSALFAGPVVSVRTGAWWATLTVLPQITSLAGEESGGRDLVHHERLETRLLFGIHL